MSLNENKRTYFANADMHWRQMCIVGLCIVLNMMDGFNALSVAFAAPGIAAEWGLQKAALGAVLSMEMFGMVVGSLCLGNLADRFGRKPMVIACLVAMTVGMFAASGAHSVAFLSAARFVTGLGIGGMLATSSVVVAEYSNARRQGLTTALNIAGYPTGAALGGFIASRILAVSGGEWRLIFMLGAIASLVALPTALFLLPETIDSLIARRPADALPRINRILGKLGHSVLAYLPAPEMAERRPSITALLGSKYCVTALLLAASYSAQVLPFYYIMKWTPKLFVEMGFTASQGSEALVAANIGGIFSAICVGIGSQKWPLRPLVVSGMVAGFFALILTNFVPHTIAAATIATAVAAFFVNIGVAGLYPVMVRAFPTHLRATGAGFVIGCGRGASALGPIGVGALFANGFTPTLVASMMATGGLVAAVMLLLVPMSDRATRAIEGKIA